MNRRSHLTGSVAVLTALLALTSTATAESPTLEQILGNWDWVSSYHPWTNQTDTPQTLGYQQSLRIELCEPTTLCIDWFREEEPVCCTISVNLPSGDPQQRISQLPSFGQVTRTGEQLVFDGTPFDGDRHTFVHFPVSTATASWSAIKALF